MKHRNRCCRDCALGLYDGAEVVGLPVRAMLSLGLMGSGLNGFGGARHRVVDAPTGADVKSSAGESRDAEVRAS